MEKLPWTIAVVEDDPSMLRSVQRLLNVHGFTTEGFSSAEAYLDRAVLKIDCLVLDVDLGGMSGIELQRQLRDSGSKLPVIFMTALEDDALETEAARAGCIAYLRKPFAAASLIDAIDKALAA
ncbi:response regulator [Phyllobacterium sp. LjRoot231]|uniref:response regulator transcription factor n=1 Tax=Phyllobacterium sp. LjRoot231 TaxID=3342289 RepID=UPI003ECD1433